MRLLDTRTGQFHWVNDPSIERYAILSHVWSLDGEQSYQDLVDLHRWSKRSRIPLIVSESYQALSQSAPHGPQSTLSRPRLSDKIRCACAAARADGYRYIWIDSCCIDKSSSTELSEAINSMYMWYRWATVCYGYLVDVNDDDDPFSTTSQFRGSQWHTRGWTLQELIAPESIVFLSRTWHPIGTKDSLAFVVEEVTGIDRAVLENPTSVYTVSVARRMSWASRRKTTRVEDEAYSLMGIFGINMPTIYGEGRRSFLRLQQAILQQVPDQSVFARGGRITNADEVAAPIPLGPGAYIPRVELQLLATSPKHFSFSAPISTLFHLDFMAALGLPADTPPPTLAATPYGIRACLPIVYHPTIRVERSDTFFGPWLYTPDCIAILACQDDHSRFITLPLCRSTAPGSHNEYVVAVGPGILFPSRLWPIPSDLLVPPEYTVVMAEILIRGGLPDSRDLDGHPSLTRDRISDKVVIHNWSRTMLAKHGYWVWDREDRREVTTGEAHIFVLYREDPFEQISIRVRASGAVSQRRLEVRHRDTTTAINQGSTSRLPSQPAKSLAMIPAESESNTEVPYRQHATYRLDDSRFLDDEGHMKYGVGIILHRSSSRDIVASRVSTQRLVPLGPSREGGGKNGRGVRCRRYLPASSLARK